MSNRCLIEDQKYRFSQKINIDGGHGLEGFSLLASAKVIWKEC